MLKPSKIRSLIIETGTSGAAIARTIGVDRSYVSHVIKGRSRNKRVRQAIASAIGLKMSDIWSDANNQKRAA
jgi:lambda repressor-like predicted transcriptional regulator